MTGRRVFWVVFAAAVLLTAGGLSYFASASPDGLDATTLRGCQVVQSTDGEQLTGDCIARHAGDHALSHSPLADYEIDGHSATGGIAGVVGAVVTVAVATAAFWLISRRRRRAPDTH